VQKSVDLVRLLINIYYNFLPIVVHYLKETNLIKTYSSYNIDLMVDSVVKMIYNTFSKHNIEVEKFINIDESL